MSGCCEGNNYTMTRLQITQLSIVREQLCNFSKDLKYIPEDKMCKLQVYQSCFLCNYWVEPHQ